MLDCSHATHRCDLVFPVAPPLASQSSARLRRWIDIFLDRLLLAHDRHGPCLVCSPILYGDLFRALGLVLWSAPATRKKERLKFDEMGPGPGSGPQQRPSSAAIAMDKIDK